MKVDKICITGAPCVGKSTNINLLKKEFNFQSIHPQFNTIKQKNFPNKEYTQLSQSEIEEFLNLVITQRIQLEKQKKKKKLSQKVESTMT